MKIGVDSPDNNALNNSWNSDVEFGSMSFIDEIPIYSKDSDLYELDQLYSRDHTVDETTSYFVENLKTIKDANESFRLGRKLCKPFNLIFPNIIDGKEIVEVEIFDIRWNDNSILWILILELLKNIL